ncbi:hypothetical protein BASA60_009026 [Batrachochytrium salamandrivorans]|nr:hypothetical protein BASA60_009026 [Batrachochytrium salamandrivorans]
MDRNNRTDLRLPSAATLLTIGALLTLSSPVSGQWIQTVTVPRCLNGAYLFKASTLEIDNIVPASMAGSPPSCLQISPTISMYHRLTMNGTVRIYECNGPTCSSNPCSLVTELLDITKLPSPECGTYFHTLTTAKHISSLIFQPLGSADLSSVITNVGIAPSASAFYTSLDTIRTGVSTIGCQGDIDSGAIHYLFEDCTRGNSTHWIQTQFSPIGRQTYANKLCTSSTCTTNCVTLNSYSKPAPPGTSSCAVGNQVDLVVYSATAIKATSEYKSNNPTNVWPNKALVTTQPSNLPTETNGVKGPSISESPTSGGVVPPGHSSSADGNSASKNGAHLGVSTVIGIVLAMFAVISTLAFGVAFVMMSKRTKLGLQEGDDQHLNDPGEYIRRPAHPQAQLYDEYRASRSPSPNLSSVGLVKTLSWTQAPESTVPVYQTRTSSIMYPPQSIYNPYADMDAADGVLQPPMPVHYHQVAPIYPPHVVGNITDAPHIPPESYSEYKDTLVRHSHLKKSLGRPKMPRAPSPFSQPSLIPYPMADALPPDLVAYSQAHQLPTEAPKSIYHQQAEFDQVVHPSQDSYEMTNDSHIHGLNPFQSPDLPNTLIDLQQEHPFGSTHHGHLSMQFSETSEKQLRISDESPSI